MKCNQCKLGLTARRNVIGRSLGSIPAKVLIIGEAPGRSEDVTGVAFTVPEGRVLDRLLNDACITSFYIVNIVRCYPPEGREPLPQEVLACTPNVLITSSGTPPELVVFLGPLAQRYYGKEFPQGVLLSHPTLILRKGGASSSLYSHNLRLLEDAYARSQDF